VCFLQRRVARIALDMQWFYRAAAAACIATCAQNSGLPKILTFGTQQSKAGRREQFHNSRKPSP